MSQHSLNYPGRGASRHDRNKNTLEFKYRDPKEISTKAERDERNFGHITRELSSGAEKTQGQNFQYEQGITVRS